MTRRKDIVVTEDEWRAELSRVMEESESDKGLTVKQIARTTGFSRKKILGLLSDLMSEGRLQCSTHMTDSIDGVRRPAPHYTLTKK